jgi:cyclic pyranopterin phosphate synthase
MEDLSNRSTSTWHAVAEAEVGVSQETISGIVDGNSPRGDVLTVAELAGVMAGKRTAELIPLAHAVPMTEILVKAVPDRAGSLIKITAEISAVGLNGVEMEAMTSAAIAALALYDMVRDFDPGAAVRGVRLVSRSGGENAWDRHPSPEPARHGPKPPKGARVAGRVGPGPRPGSHGPARHPDR